MYKILIVDDEKFIRKSIRNRMNWEQFDIEVAGEAGNGQAALELIKELHPQIVLVDIRMPVMDGITFIREAKRLYPKVYYIIMSAYSDFEYAQQAIRLGVEDYILKPMKPAELEKVLKKIIGELDRKRLTNHLLAPVEKAEIESLLHGNLVAALAFYMENPEGAGSLLESAMEHAMGNLEKTYTLYYLKDFSAGDCYVFLLNGDSLQEEDCRLLVQEVWDELGNYEGVAAYAEVMERSRVRRAVENSIHLLVRKLFHPEKKILTARQRADKAASQKRKEQIQEELGFLYQQKGKGDKGKLEKLMEHIVQLTINRESTVWMMESVIAELIVFLKKAGGENWDETEYAILFNGLSGRNYLLRYQTEEEVKARLFEVIHNCLAADSENEESDVVETIKKYIRENFSTDLNAAETARKFYLNASYLSTLFKEKTGMNMGAYIEGVRMEKAGQFLKETQWSVTDIAIRCGYSDSNYFSKVFKKYTGVTPRQYRERTE